MKNLPTLIFDFDGTIADSFPQWVSVFQQLSSEFGYHKIPQPDVSSTNGHPIVTDTCREDLSYVDPLKGTPG